jgi:DNA-binding CsgD family transcriptional regulator
MSRARQRSPQTKPSAGASSIGRDTRATTFTCGGDTFAVLSLPAFASPLPEALSAAEREVCQLLLSGASNAEIAERRGTKVRTIANQVASILRKLGAASRSELPAALARYDA